MTIDIGDGVAETDPPGYWNQSDQIFCLFKQGKDYDGTNTYATQRVGICTFSKKSTGSTGFELFNSGTTKPGWQNVEIRLMEDSDPANDYTQYKCETQHQFFLRPTEWHTATFTTIIRHYDHHAVYKVTVQPTATLIRGSFIRFTFYEASLNQNYKDDLGTGLADAEQVPSAAFLEGSWNDEVDAICRIFKGFSSGCPAAGTEQTFASPAPGLCRKPAIICKLDQTINTGT